VSRPEPSWNTLQEAFALGSPVLVLGPGCHRIGYDRGHEWEVVVHRMTAVWNRLADDADAEEPDARRRFLDRFWFDQLSEETREATRADREDLDDQTSLPVDQNIRETSAVVPRHEGARIALAVDVLNVLIECTRLLGAVIETGVVPVTDWQRVNDGNDAPDEARSVARERARRWLERASALAGALNALCTGRRLASRELRALSEHGLTDADGAYDKLTLLKVGSIETALKALVEDRLGSDDGRLSGAVVEWLSDLFWHIIVSGASVPPSQDELDFYLNLSDKQDDTERRFSRPHPGEYRGPNDGGRALRADLAALLHSYDSGLEQRTRNWRRPRERFARTMAASLVETWRAHPDVRLVLALVSDYDVMFERATMEILDDGEAFHVLVPALVDPDRDRDQAGYEWLYGTYERGGTRAGKELTKPRWQWLTAAPADAPRGPIVVRLAGSPLSVLGTVAELGLPLEDTAYKGHERLVAAAVHSEHDAVRAIMALTHRVPGVGSHHNLASAIFGPKGLTWKWRSWLFFGHRFRDWLPRLQLLFTALWLAGPADKAPLQAPPSMRIAVDRTFDWPEQALLRALQIDMVSMDLDRVSSYFEPRTTHHEAASGHAESRKVVRFLEQVREVVGVSGAESDAA
jgi:hypothetical protein